MPVSPRRAALGLRLAVAVTTAPIAASLTPAHAQEQLGTIVEWRWSQADTEIHGPAFSPDGRILVLSTRPHMPETWAAAETRPPARLVRIWKRGAKDPRFADPRVTIVAPGQKPRFLGYGWQPRFTADGRRVIFARQVNPIGHHRILLSTLSGNDVAMVDLAGGEERVITRPQHGSMHRPDPTPDGKALIYYQVPTETDDSAVPTALARIDLDGKAAPETLFLPQPSKTAPTTSIVRHLWLGTDLVGAFTDTGERLELTNLTAPGHPNLGPCTAHTFGAAGQNLVVLDGGSWVVKDVRSGKSVERLPGPARPLRRAALDPGGRLWAHVTTVENGRRKAWELRLLDWRTGTERRILESKRELSSLAWAPDGKHLAAVAMGDPEAMDRDELVVFKVTGSPAP